MAAESQESKALVPYVRGCEASALPKSTRQGGAPRSLGLRVPEQQPADACREDHGLARQGLVHRGPLNAES